VSATVAYDVTRLVTRGLNAAPNGIDRVDFALARRLLGAAPAEALLCTLRGPRRAPGDLALRSIDEIETFWRETGSSKDDAAYARVVAALTNAAAPERIVRSLRGDIVRQNLRAAGRWALRGGLPASSLPPGAVYVNATGFLVDKPWFVRFLEQRADVKPVFFVHDLLPLEAPEYFRPVECANHARRIANICRLAAGVVVASHVVERSLQRFAARNGGREFPVCVARLPVARVFETPAIADPALVDRAYFVMCGTIEPRKNHATILNVWRDLAERGEAPQLVVVGKRGWLNDATQAMMSRCPALRGKVIETGGLSTPGLRRLLAGARALLMPSHAEGFGLPVAEAMTARVPVIASDIPVFREVGRDAIDLVDPIDGPGWRQAILDHAAPQSPRRQAILDRLAALGPDPAASFFEDVERFVASL